MNLKQIIDEYKKVSGGLDKDCEFISSSITQLLEELREEDKKHKVFECNGTNSYETWCEDENCPSWEAKMTKGYNQRNHEINSKINKILNK